MAEKLIFHYHDRKTILHKIDPRAKMLTLCIVTILVFELPPLGLFLLIPYIIIGIISAKIPIGEYRRESLFFGVFSLIIFLTRLWGSSLVLPSLLGVVRFLTIVVVGMLLTDTTAPEEMSLALFWFLHPFSKKFAYATAARLNLTVSFFPIIFDASQEMLDARRSRHEHVRRHPIRRMISMGTQLLAMILDRAEDISYALESRGFREDVLHGTLSWGRHDTLFILITILYVGSICYITLLT